MNCGNCLLDRVELVALAADGTCPKCGAYKTSEPRSQLRNPVPAEPPEYARDFVCGTRRAFRKGTGDFRVVCATCGAGGSTWHRTREAATSAAVRDSAKACKACGAD